MFLLYVCFAVDSKNEGNVYLYLILFCFVDTLIMFFLLILLMYFLGEIESCTG